MYNKHLALLSQNHLFIKENMTSDYAISFELRRSFSFSSIRDWSQFTNFISTMVVPPWICFIISLIELVFAVLDDCPPLSLISIVFFVLTHKFTVTLLLLNPLLCQQLTKLPLHLVFGWLYTLERFIDIFYNTLVLFWVFLCCLPGR